MNPEVIKLSGSPEERRARERAAALAEQCAGYVEYIAMMCDVELPQDDEQAYRGDVADE